MRRAAAFAGMALIVMAVAGAVTAQSSLPTASATPIVTPTPMPLADVLAIGSAFNGGNTDWQAQYPEGLQYTFDDNVPMVLVPAGCFMMGTTEAEIDLVKRYMASLVWPSGPQHQHCIETPFWIDRTELTQSDFARLGGAWIAARYFTEPNRPAEQITWFEAHDLCARRGARLPTEAEWEYAARGPDSWLTLWGDMSNSNSAAGRSWVGALDMSGGVFEWTSSLNTLYPYHVEDGREADTGSRTDVLRVVRGGIYESYLSYEDNIIRRSSLKPDTVTELIGFRCARSFVTTPPVTNQTPAVFLVPTYARTQVPMFDAQSAGSVFNDKNTDWQAQYPEGLRHSFEDDVPMMLVPAGCFVMGSSVEDGRRDEHPAHEQCFDVPFWIDRTEVTQADFARLGGVQAEQSYFSGADRPVEQITWFEARDFCALRGARLPTEAEWEYAARGPESWIYPWGNTWDEGNAIWNGNSDIQTERVGSLPDGRSWISANDMAGNVWEWTSSVYEPYPYNMTDGREIGSNAPEIQRVVRGGSWLSNSAEPMRSSNRDKLSPDVRNHMIGVRCARSAVMITPIATASPVVPFRTTVMPSSSTNFGLVEPSFALAIGQAFSGSNADWMAQYPDGVQYTFEDGVAMILVPASCFQMGMTDAEIEDLVARYPDRVEIMLDNGPQHEQCFDAPFWIDRTEVTQADFARLGGVQAEQSYFSGANRPVEQITWFEARDFCALRGARLPTEAEWEYAARGPESWIYPWGNAWDEDNAVWDGNSNETAPVGSRPAGRSWVGADDMIGNVSEYTSSLLEAYPYVAGDGRERDIPGKFPGGRVSRGGSWMSARTNYPRAAGRTGLMLEIFESDSRGFRCVRSAGPAQATSTPTITPTASITNVPAMTLTPSITPTSTVTSTPISPVIADAIGSAFTEGNVEWRAQYPDGLPYRFDDGVVMVLVPAGCFMMGMTDSEVSDLIRSYGSSSADLFLSFRPQHQQCFDAPFWIDRTEVTQGDFARLGGMQAEQSEFIGAEHPVEQITWFEARDFCVLRGASLPTEAEWEYAARGPEGWRYPWGNAFNADSAVWGGDRRDWSAPVGSRPSGRSWVGAFDMSGNVWEWTNSLYDRYPGNAVDDREIYHGSQTDNLRIARGGSWFFNADSLHAGYRNPYEPGTTYINLGFRCARSHATPPDSIDSVRGITSTPTAMPAPDVTPTPAPLVYALAAGRAFTGGNNDWLAQYPGGLQLAFDDGVPMVLVPAGCFMMGMTYAEIYDLISEYGAHSAEFFRSFGPQHPQCFDAPFWIDRTEVTQADFARLGGVQAEQSYFSGADRPVEQITWFEARDFCALRGARLPTEAEWEYAARGPESWIYPWGNIWDNDFPIWNSSGTETVGSQSESRSWAGAQDMSGNVSEWTSSQHWPYPYSASDGREEDTGSQADVARAARGNSWSGDDESYLRAAFRYRVSPVDWGNPEGRYSNLGFRCARSS